MINDDDIPHDDESGIDNEEQSYLSAMMQKIAQERAISYAETLVYNIKKNELKQVYSGLINTRFKPIGDTLLYNQLKVCFKNIEYLIGIKNPNLDTKILIDIYKELLTKIGDDYLLFKLSSSEKIMVRDFISPDELGAESECVREVPIYELLNWFVHRIYTHTPRKQYLIDRKRRKEKNKHIYRQCIALRNCLRKHYAKLVVIRLDFSFREDNEVDIKSAKKYFLRFLKHLHNQKSIQSTDYIDVAGYLWKLEYGSDKGFHFHTMFFLNGNTHQHDKRLGELLGKKWKAITNNQGKFWNCNRSKNKYMYLAIGRIHHAEEQKFKDMEKIFSYFAKSDQAVADLGIKNIRTFGSSQSSSTNATRRGRPRNQ